MRTWNLVKGLIAFAPLISTALVLNVGALVLSDTVHAVVVASSKQAPNNVITDKLKKPGEEVETEPATDEIHLVVKLRAKTVYVYRGLEIIATYSIAVGKSGWETPKGIYKVFEQEINPIFKSFKTGRIIQPGPENPLGPRWIGIWTDGKTRLGFHGTNQPELIGQAVSHGCIRMHNKDVIALFDKVKVGTVVKVEP
ncbi:L,D-transpeptidase [Calothrix sp. HK-06]|nr:L,D-transpeptidase [Calothrix sp. HK-06]